MPAFLPAAPAQVNLDKIHRRPQPSTMDQYAIMDEWAFVDRPTTPIRP
jgi:hypothetical protein